jgi:hypothetical protein
MTALRKLPRRLAAGQTTADDEYLCHSYSLDRFAGRFVVVPFFPVFSAVDFAADFSAVDFVADFLAVDFAGDFSAVDFLADFVAAVVFFAGDFFAGDFRAKDCRPPPLEPLAPLPASPLLRARRSAGVGTPIPAGSSESSAPMVYSW